MSAQVKLVEEAISASLRSLGYFKIEVERSTEEKLCINADGLLRKIILLVIIINASAKVAKQISEPDISSIKEKAESSHREPWSAFVTVTNNGKVDHIKWNSLATV
jgi:hypothetical protein